MSTAQLLRLRPYQREAIDAVFEAWNEGIQRPAIVLSTGLGKTVIFSHLISEFIKKTGERVVVLVHRDELADQALDKLRDVAPHLLCGKVKARDNDTGADVVVASVQTLARKGRLEQLGKRGLVIADEVHHYGARTFKDVLERLGCFTENGTKFLGVTATLTREGGGLGEIIDEVVYTKSMMFGISKGYLVKPEGRLIVTKNLDLKNVKTSRGDYQTGDLGRAVEESGLADILPAAYREHAMDRQGIIFVPTVANAQHVADSLTDAGIPTAMVCGETPREERLHIFEQYRKGRIQVLSNAMVLTEGWDMPQASCAVIARPTKSQGLYIQMVGRIMRPYPGKTSALILDVVGSTLDNKLMTLIDLDSEMFREKTPCEVCECIPCVCPCEVCGFSKKECICPKEERPEVSLLTEGINGELDLFSSSSQSWLSTTAGVMFIPVGEGEVFLWQSKAPGTWDVGYAPKQGKWLRLHEALPLGTAMAWAETEADERQEFSTRRTASWRKRKASEAQLNFARSLKINFSGNVKSGDLGNLISIAMASRRLDPKLPKS